MNKDKRVFIIHGWDGYPDEGWFPWLKIELEKIGFKVHVPPMPKPSEPKIEAWVSHLSEVVGDVDESTYFVGHSIGCQTILRYLENLPPEKQAGGATFVAGWFTLMNLKTDEEKKTAEPWLETPINFEKIKEHTKNIFAIFSDNDDVVPKENREFFKKRLGAHTAMERGKGHFSGDDGITELPIVLETILFMVGDGKIFSCREGETEGSKKIPSRLPFLKSQRTTRLNKYISNAGVCSRREADQLIKTGAISVNGEVITEMGHKVSDLDIVRYNEEVLKPQRNVYLLLNKPEDYITTSDDPKKRKTVLELIKGAYSERIYPVGRLDRNTTGVLLLTNDGDLTTKLTHPKFGVKKIYHVELTKSLKLEDFRTIQRGIELDDGPIKPDRLSYVREENKKVISIEIHSGRNRIVRRIFEHFGYVILKLDRISFAGLTKENLPSGQWRFLTKKEVAFLRMVPNINPKTI